MITNDLSKMGCARVSIKVLDGVSFIHKQRASDVEINFYRFAASKLDGVNTPKLIKLEGDDLFIEYIPGHVSLEELCSNNNALAQLSKIHKSSYIPSFSVKRHEWKNEDTERALDLLDISIVSQSTVKHIQKLSSDVFAYPSLISGDTNSGNWGTRANNELVLFDWERFGYGSPAIDLAPLIKGLGTIKDYELIIDKYIQHNSVLTKEELLRHLIIAKCWIIVEVVNILKDRDNPQTLTYTDWYHNTAPEWLNSIKKAL